MIHLLSLFALGSFLAQVSAREEPLKLHVSMISLGVKNPSASIKFYGETLGLQLLGKPGEVTFFRAGEITIVLNQPAELSAGSSMSGAVEIIFPVDSVSAMKDKLTGRGCRFMNDPHEVTTGMWAATFPDPDGHMLTLFGPK